MAYTCDTAVHIIGHLIDWKLQSVCGLEVGVFASRYGKYSGEVGCLLSLLCDKILSTIKVVVLKIYFLHKYFMVYFPFQITDSYIYISLLTFKRKQLAVPY